MSFTNSEQTFSWSEKHCIPRVQLEEERDDDDPKIPQELHTCTNLKSTPSSKGLNTFCT